MGLFVAFGKYILMPFFIATGSLASVIEVVETNKRIESDKSMKKLSPEKQFSIYAKRVVVAFPMGVYYASGFVKEFYDEIAKDSLK
jgi:hypothetical protein